MIPLGNFPFAPFSVTQPTFLHVHMFRLDRGCDPEDCPDDDVRLHGHLLRHRQARRLPDGHSHLIPRLPPARGQENFLRTLKILTESYY